MRGWRIVSVAATVAAFGASLYLWHFRAQLLPREVPVHWDAHFQADQFVARDAVLPYFLIAPSFMAFFVLLTPALRWLSPRNFAVDRFGPVYEYVMALVVLLLAYLHGVVLWAGTTAGNPPGQAFLAPIFLFFAFLGNVLGRVQQNFWMGVRTPWTLASEAVWIRTHRLAAWLFVGFGLGGFAATLAGVPILWPLAGLGVVVLAPVVYSLVLYKKLQRQGKV